MKKILKVLVLNLLYNASFKFNRNFNVGVEYWVKNK